MSNEHTPDNDVQSKSLQYRERVLKRPPSPASGGGQQAGVLHTSREEVIEWMKQIVDAPYGLSRVGAASVLKMGHDAIQAHERQSDVVDLMRDEFVRIKAFVPNNAEVVGLCERATKLIEQRVPVIVQRDDALARLAAAEKQQAAQAEELDKLREVVASLEWSGRSEYGLSPGVRRYAESCPVCGGINPACAGARAFIESSHGHRPGCALAAANTKAGDNGRN